MRDLTKMFRWNRRTEEPRSSTTLRLRSRLGTGRKHNVRLALGALHFPECAHRGQRFLHVRSLHLQLVLEPEQALHLVFRPRTLAVENPGHLLEGFLRRHYTAELVARLQPNLTLLR